MDRGSWQATVHGVTKSQTQLKQLSTYFCFLVEKLYSSVQSLSHVWLLRPHGPQNPRPLWPSPTPGVHSNSCPLSQWCHPIISSSGIPVFSCLQSFPASRSFLISQFLISGGKRIRVSASASVLLMDIQDSFPLGLIGWLSMQSKGLLRVFSSTIVQKNQFFGGQLSLWSNSYMHTWLLEKP